MILEAFERAQIADYSADMTVKNSHKTCVLIYGYSKVEPDRLERIVIAITKRSRGRVYQKHGRSRSDCGWQPISTEALLGTQEPFHSRHIAMCSLVDVLTGLGTCQTHPDGKGGTPGRDANLWWESGHQKAASGCLSVSRTCCEWLVVCHEDGTVL